MLKIICAIVFVFGLVLWGLNACGTIQRAKDACRDKGAIAKAIFRLLQWAFTPAIITLGSVVVMAGLFLGWFGPNKPKLTLSIEGLAVRPVMDGTLLQFICRLENSGGTATTRNWMATIKTGATTQSVNDTPGEIPARASLTLKDLDEETATKPIGKNKEITGHLFFVFIGQDPKSLLTDLNDGTATLEISAKDQRGENWKTFVDYQALKKEHYEVQSRDRL